MRGILYCKLAYVYSLALLIAFVLGGWYMSLYSSLFCFSFLCILPVYSRAWPFFVNIFLSLFIKNNNNNNSNLLGQIQIISN